MTAPAAAPRASPMIEQYRAIKAQHPDALLFFRMGDFFEMFFEDAVQAAPALEVALTRRGRHEDEDIPMCGVPVHQLETYLHRAIRKGFKVAICEQIEDPAEARKRPGRPLVQRDVIRVVTPGTLTEDGLLQPSATAWLAAVARRRDRLGVARLDLSTGRLLVEPLAAAELATVLARIEPAELLVADASREDRALQAAVAERTTPVTYLPDGRFSAETAERRLRDRFGVASLDGFGTFEPQELAALGALLDYVDLTQKGAAARIEPPLRVVGDACLRIDPWTRRSLEILATTQGDRDGSLLGTIDRTVTAPGARLLAERLSAPLVDASLIRSRLDRVEALGAPDSGRDGLRRSLRGVPDLERGIARLALGRGGPRDIAAIGRGLAIAGSIRAHLSCLAPFSQTLDALDGHAALATRIEATLVESPPLLARDGGLVRDGVIEALDRARSLRDDARRHVAALEAEYREATGIASLKIRHNQLIGFYIEVTAAHADKAPPEWRRRQGMAGATRFSTDALAALEAEIERAGEEAVALEMAVFEDLRAAVLDVAEAVTAAARALAAIDVDAALAEIATEHRWTRPSIHEDTRFEVVAGRHPVVDAALARRAERFVANDCDLGEGRRLWLLTGPNMAGKSTFLRQNALLVVLAQAGSFVPAERAAIGLVDRLFSRVGASDDLARGRSTFMVEMLEAAAILNQATPRSLVVLDEIGRGTATWDGLSLAWAILEHLHDRIGCRTLFATHYHELNALRGRLRDLACRSMKVKEWQGGVVFLHEVAAGAADRSYGIHVARLAGLPDTVLRRAANVLKRLESGETRAELPLFAGLAEEAPHEPEPPPDTRIPAEAARLLVDTDPDGLTPREAHDLLYKLSALVRGGGGGST